jgi:hypothetical protein
MADDKFVPLDAFLTTTKTLLTLIHELTVAMQVQRVALMQVQALPVQADYLKSLAVEIREIPHLRAAREAIASLNTTEEISEVLRKFEGPLQ